MIGLPFGTSAMRIRAGVRTGRDATGVSVLHGSESIARTDCRVAVKVPAAVGFLAPAGIGARDDHGAGSAGACGSPRDVQGGSAHSAASFTSPPSPLPRTVPKPSSQAVERWGALIQIDQTRETRPGRPDQGEEHARCVVPLDQALYGRR